MKKVIAFADEFGNNSFDFDTQGSHFIIASSRDGYKIQNSASNIKKYINHGKSIVFPVLRRIEECRNAILLATINEYDILGDPEYQKLRELIEKT